MRKQLTFLLVLFSFSSFGQKIIELKNKPVIIENRRFYIEDIIDGRASKESIGTADVGLFNKTVDAKFSKTAEEVFTDLLKPIFQKTEDKQVGVILKINHLNISEHRTLYSEYGRAEIQLSFFAKNSHGLYLLNKAESFVEVPSITDVTAGHEKRIRKVIEQCLVMFNDAHWEESENELSVVNTEELETVTDNPIAINTGFNKIKNRVTLTYSPYIGTMHDGFNINLYLIPDSIGDKWVFPSYYSLELITKFHEEKIKNYSISEVSIRYSKIGMLGIKNLNSNLHLSLGGSIIIGSEELTYFNGGQLTRSLLGFEFRENLILIPKSTGVFASIGAFQTFIPSDLFQMNLGVRFEVGIKF